MKTAGSFQMLPARPDVCQVCATDHAPEQPHNASSLYYQFAFHAEHGRSPNWLDAMAHCDAYVKELWTLALEKKGVDVKGGKVYPSKKVEAKPV